MSWQTLAGGGKTTQKTLELRTDKQEPVSTLLTGMDCDVQGAGRRDASVWGSSPKYSPKCAVLGGWGVLHQLRLFNQEKKMSEYTDTQLLDFLDSLSGTYTGKVVCRMSTRGRGWRLHETSRDDGEPDVRTAIITFIKMHQ